MKLKYLIASLAVITSYGAEALAQEPAIFLADPTIFPDKGKYYLYGTSSGRGFLTYESNDLQFWKQAEKTNEGLSLTKGDAFGGGGFWAPQIFKYKGNYYMAYTADEQIAIAMSSRPTGPFKQQKIRALSGAGKQIDPYVFFDTDGKIYLYHVRLTNGNRIFVAEMNKDLSDIIPGTEKECISSIEPWENTANSDWPVAEGPTVLKRKGYYYLIYSANDFRNKDYAVGYAVAKSPLGPWKKYQGNPIISTKNIGFNGTGHGDVFEDRGGDLKYVMHTHRSETKVSPRGTGVVDIRFKENKNGEDVLQADGSSFKWLQLKK